MSHFHHLHEANIVSFASGTLSDDLTPVVIKHVARCTECRNSVRFAEAIGGALLEALQPQKLLDGAFEAVMQRINQHAS